MSALWIYIRIQLAMFVFGIVGPIFLVIYFTSQPDPTMKAFEAELRLAEAPWVG